MPTLIRALCLCLALSGCAGAAVWAPVAAGALGIIAGGEQIIAEKDAPQPAPPAQEPVQDTHPALDGTWIPP